jgi:Protein of unknown function (DUF3352)
MRAVAVALLAGLTLAVAGCGGSNVGAGASPASLLRPGAVVYWETATDPDSEQWDQFEELLRRFPDGDKWLATLEKKLLPALGDQLAVAVYATEGSQSSQAVVLTNPDDPERSVARIKELDDDAATRVLGDWVVAADTRGAIDAALKGDGAALADDENFKAALAALPDDALSRVYADPGRYLQLAGTLDLFGLADLDFAGAWAKTRKDGAELEFVLRGDGVDRLLGDGEPYTSTLLQRVPDDAFAFLSFRGEALKRSLEQLRANPLLAVGLRELEREYGVDVDELATLLDGEVAFFARPGRRTPEFTLLFETKDAAGAKATIERLLRRVPDDPRLSVGALNGIVAVSTARDPLDELGAPGDKLADNARFNGALELVGAPDRYSGLAYLDLAKARGLIAAHAGAEVGRNLKPLRSLVALGTKDGDLISARAFLEID